MITRLDALLDSIHPEQTRNKLMARMDETINRFRIETNRIPDAIMYRDIVTRFLQQLEWQLGTLPSGVDLPEPMLWDRASRLLRKAYGPHGEVAAFETQRSGAEGGLLGVLRRIASVATNERLEEEVAARVDSFCHRLSAEEFLAAGREYLDKHGHLLPAEITQGFAARARLNLAALLKQHHRLLVATTRVSR